MVTANPSGVWAAQGATAPSVRSDNRASIPANFPDLFMKTPQFVISLALLLPRPDFLRPQEMSAPGSCTVPE